MKIIFEDIIKKLEYIKTLGFVSAKYSHDGGVGNTLEKLLEIKENNIKLPDLEIVEIKAKQVDSESMLTLTSKTPKPRGINKKLFESYSHIAKDGIRKLYTTIYGSRLNIQGFRVVFDNDKLRIINSKNIDAYWFTKEILEQLTTKANKTLLVLATKKGEKKHNNLKYHYYEAHLLSGLSDTRIKEAIKNGKLKIDIRIGADKTGKKIGKYHDHGTGIRISKRDYLSLFESSQQYI